MEPLGQSQVLPYLKGLSKEYSITLITFEKANDYADKHMLARLQEQCELYGINWIIKKYPNTPHFYTVFTNFLIMFYVTFKRFKTRLELYTHGLICQLLWGIISNILNRNYL